MCIASDRTTAAAEVRETWERVRWVREGLVASQVERFFKKRSPREGLFIIPRVVSSLLPISAAVNSLPAIGKY